MSINRRSLLASAAGLPFLGWLKPSESHGSPVAGGIASENQKVAQSLRELADQIERSTEQWYRRDSIRTKGVVNDLGQQDWMFMGSLVGVTNLPDVAESLQQRPSC